MKNRYCNSTTTCSSLIGAAVVSALALPTVVWAQTADATLRGTAPANSTVTARNTDTGLTRRTTTGTGGTYVLVGLPPGNYRVDAGPGTETLVTLQVASTSDLDLSPTLEQVIVTASRRHEMKTSEVANVVSQHEIETTPQITRNFLEFADTVPGMQFQIDSDGHTSLRGGAQSTAAVNVYIDGVGQKDYVLAGGPTGQDSTQGNPFPQLAISEYKVVTSNYKAEYGQVSSAAIIADTKSGTNEFHGQAFGNYTSDSWRAMTPSEAHAGRQTPSSNKEFGFAIGGPIIQDKAHFFVTYEGKKFATPKAVLPQFTAYNSLLPAGVVAQFGPADKAFDETLVFGKLDFEPTDADRLELQV